MSRQRRGTTPKREHWFRSLQIRCSQSIGVSLRRRRALYQELIETVSLRDTSYWLQILFAAGIATLGLVMNSSAVIIGAMLISPLMGMILANGLAFAAGDFILAVRAIINLTLSCALSVGFAMLLVACLPFKDMTPEILARTQPNILDLVIALFSGALAAVMMAKEHKGAMNSIPGVAIAVALMPPLCVVGYGIGLAVSLNWDKGIQAASGGGLLFLTNFAAITLMAMVVFTLLRIDTFGIRDEVDQWHADDPESNWIERFLHRFDGLKRLRISGTIFSRFVVLSLPLMVLLVPLSQSFSRLNQDLAKKDRSNKIAQASRDLWENNLGKDGKGNTRSHIDRLLIDEKPDIMTVQMTVFTNRAYSEEEKQGYTTLLAAALQRKPETIQLRLLEIPTASYELLQARTTETTPQQIAIPTITEYQAKFISSVDGAMRSFQLPQGKQLINYYLALRPQQPLGIQLAYLAKQPISADAQSLLQQNLRDRLNQPDLKMQIQWVDTAPDDITFNAYGEEVGGEGIRRLEAIATILQQYPEVHLEVALPPTNFEPEDIVQARFKAVQQIMQKRWSIPQTQVRASAQQPKLNQATEKASAPKAELRLVKSEVVIKPDAAINVSNPASSPSPTPNNLPSE